MNKRQTKKIFTKLFKMGCVSQRTAYRKGVSLKVIGKYGERYAFVKDELIDLFFVLQEDIIPSIQRRLKKGEWSDRIEK